MDVPFAAVTDEHLRAADVILVADPADPSFLLPLRPSFFLGRTGRAGMPMAGDLVVLTDAAEGGRQVTVPRHRIAMIVPAGD
jgi:hypothetical protein